MLPDGYPPLDIYLQVLEHSMFTDMENFSRTFLRNNATALKYYSKKWVADPLHTWSRRWEYVFVYERIKQTANRLPGMRVLDLGSGLTFFPHFLKARHPNISLHCCDNDPRLELDAGKLVEPAAALVSFSKQDISKLTYRDASFDALYCISVLEHCSDYDKILKGFARILKPGGRLILTFDISLDGRSEITRAQAHQLIQQIEKHFVSDSDYGMMIGECEDSQILTTRYAHEQDPSLLPWKALNPLESVRYFLRHRHVFETPFYFLTCFCMGWTLL